MAAATSASAASAIAASGMARRSIGKRSISISGGARQSGIMRRRGAGGGIVGAHQAARKRHQRSMLPLPPCGGGMAKPALALVTAAAT
jgi:hypothetical protein